MVRKVKKEFHQMLPFPDRKYTIIYADPPWSYRDSAQGKGVVFKYPCQTDDWIYKLPVQDICNENSVLFLWATFPKLQTALNTIESWGFTYKTIAFNWVKTTATGKIFFGMGNWTRSNSEVCLLGVKGKPKRKSAGVSSVILAPIRAHSQKPDIARNRIVELCGNKSRIELFARQKVKGWHCWGNEV